MKYTHSGHNSASGLNPLEGILRRISAFITFFSPQEIILDGWNIYFALEGGGEKIMFHGGNPQKFSDGSKPKSH